MVNITTSEHKLEALSTKKHHVFFSADIMMKTVSNFAHEPEEPGH